MMFKNLNVDLKLLHAQNILMGSIKRILIGKKQK